MHFGRSAIKKKQLQATELENDRIFTKEIDHVTTPPTTVKSCHKLEYPIIKNTLAVSRSVTPRTN